MRERLEGIQWLRAVAALLVVVDHCLYMLSDRGVAIFGGLGFASFIGSFGVKLFFVISGAVMLASSSSYFGKPGATSNFLLRRLIRVVPMYWLATGIYLAKERVMGRSFSVDEILASMFFVPYMNADNLMQPVYGLGWTLNCEIYFYTLFAIALLCSERRGVALLVSYIFVAAALGSGVDRPPVGYSLEGAFYFYSRSIFLYFATGVAIAFVVRQLGAVGNFRLRARTVAILFFAVLALVLVLGFWDRANLPVGITSCALLLFVAMQLREAEDLGYARKLAARLGDASYSIYLFHIFICSVLVRLLARLGMLNQVIFIASALIVVSVFSIFLFDRIEKPLLKKMNQRLLSV